ncbi:conserved Plasmodium protein, unknown function [Plasmodium gallinaceum]|uniref:MHD domain-containing protein n=1 Tax=Plasmodium gallinaceum TaxID=5849 RepID=A0A1J1H337_PLAGA|nr:conserved Plasmodium protein, unknown function [Plasmodium gallinaceum]CRG97901.1 conserved Plasmodium protein, unknown function [Plasmodium gallinaceum]
MNGIRALFLFKSKDVNYDLVYQKIFFNVEICAKSIQELNYVNIFKLKNIDDLIREQIINKKNQDIDTHKEYIELNKTVSCYSIHVKNKILYPFLFMEKKNLLLVTLLYIDDSKSNNISIMKNNTDKLLYYNFMDEFLNYIETNFFRNKRFSNIKDNELCNNLILQKFTKILDIYISSVIPYGRFYRNNSFFLNYLKKDIYKCEDILQSNFFIFYNFLFLINDDNTILNENKQDTLKNKPVIEYNESRNLIKNENENENYIEKKKHNDILYVNNKPSFVVYKNDFISNKNMKYNFRNLLFTFFTLVNQNRILNRQISKNYYSLFLLFFYNYSIMFEENKRIPIINKFDQNENIKISKENIQTYVPLYMHEKNKDDTLVIIIKEELNCFVTNFENENAELKGEIILKSDEEKYLDIDMMIQLDNKYCDIYATDLASIEKIDGNLKIKVSSKYPSHRLLTYYYRNLICPIIGYYKVRNINEKQIEINVILQWNNKIPYIKTSKKKNEHFFLKFPFPNEIINHNLKCDMGKIKYEKKNEIKWILNDFDNELPVKLFGIIEFNGNTIPKKQLVAEINIFSKSNYSKTKIIKINKKYSIEYFFESKYLILLCS